MRIATARGRERWGRGVRCSASQLPPPRCNHIRRCKRYTRRAARRPPAHRRSASQQAEGATASHSAPRLRRAPPEARCTRRRPCSPARRAIHTSQLVIPSWSPLSHPNRLLGRAPSAHMARAARLAASDRQGGAACDSFYFCTPCTRLAPTALARSACAVGWRSAQSGHAGGRKSGGPLGRTIGLRFPIVAMRATSQGL